MKMLSAFRGASPPGMTETNVPKGCRVPSHTWRTGPSPPCSSSSENWDFLCSIFFCENKEQDARRDAVSVCTRHI